MRRNAQECVATALDVPPSCYIRSWKVALSKARIRMITAQWSDTVAAIIQQLSSTHISQLTLLFTALASLATGLAAVGVLLQVKRARETYAAQIYLSFSDRYNSE